LAPSYFTENAEKNKTKRGKKENNEKHEEKERRK
jgi:hypothetical protein